MSILVIVLICVGAGSGYAFMGGLTATALAKGRPIFEDDGSYFVGGLAWPLVLPVLLGSILGSMLATRMQRPRLPAARVVGELEDGR